MLHNIYNRIRFCFTITTILLKFVIPVVCFCIVGYVGNCSGVYIFQNVWSFRDSNQTFLTPSSKLSSVLPRLRFFITTFSMQSHVRYVCEFRIDNMVKLL